MFANQRVHRHGWLVALDYSIKLSAKMKTISEKSSFRCSRENDRSDALSMETWSVKVLMAFERA
jgi:hypothetical protein